MPKFCFCLKQREQNDTTINHRGVTSSTVIQSKHPLLGRRLACLMDGKVGLALKTTDNVCLHVQKKIVNDSTIFVDDSTIFVDNSTIFLDTLASTMHSWMTWQHRHVLKTKHSWMRWQHQHSQSKCRRLLQYGETASTLVSPGQHHQFKWFIQHKAWTFSDPHT